VPIDFSRQSRATLDFAVGLARGIDIKLHLLHVIDPVSWDDFRGSGSLNYIDYRDFCADLTRRRLASLMPPDLLGRAEVTVCAGSAAEEIPRHAVAIGASVIILGVDPKGRSDAAGAPPIAILQKSPCPILVVPESAKAASRTHAPAELAAAH
jgi:nucleotide-binding universal stress UspA family protein